MEYYRQIQTNYLFSNYGIWNLQKTNTREIW